MGVPNWHALSDVDVEVLLTRLIETQPELSIKPAAKFTPADAHRKRLRNQRRLSEAVANEDGVWIRRHDSSYSGTRGPIWVSSVHRCVAAGQEAARGDDDRGHGIHTRILRSWPPRP